MVFTSTQSGSDIELIVGVCSAGSTFSTLSRLFLGTFIISPTLPSAAMAPFSIMTMFSILRRLNGFFRASLFAMNRVVDCNSSSTMRRLFARSELPVSVTSTIASANRGGFTSVAPQLNSTCAFTPCRSKYRWVIFTTSVAIRLPSKSLGPRIGESSGTASTQRTGRRLTLLNTNSVSSVTFASFSNTQS